MWDHGKVIEAFLDQETNNTIGMEDEVCSLRVLVSDHGEQGYKLWCLRKDMDVLLLHLSRDSGCWLLCLRAIVRPYTQGGGWTFAVGRHSASTFMSSSLQLETESTLLILSSQSKLEVTVHESADVIFELIVCSCDRYCLHKLR